MKPSSKKGERVWVAKAKRTKFIPVWTTRKLKRDAQTALDEWSMDPSEYTIRRATLVLDQVRRKK